MIILEKKLLNIVAIFAHPDDCSISCAGTLAKWAEQGHTLYAICCTSGNVGTLRTNLTMEQVGAMREKELRAANEIIGVKETIMLGYPDAGFIDGPELREKLVYQVRKLKADRVVTFDPWVTYEVHPDHVMVARMASEAAAFAAFPLLYPEQLKDDVEPHPCSEVWLTGLLGHPPNVYVDISSTLEKKIDSAMKFEATVTLLADLFAPDIDPANVSPEELTQLFKHAEFLMRFMAKKVGKKVKLKAAEPFYVQKTLPGHFDNFQQQMLEMLGEPPEQPKIL